MADVAHTETKLGIQMAGGIAAALVTWTPLTSTNTGGDAWENRAFGDMAVQVSGTFGGATVLIEGSNDNSNWFTLNDPQGTALSIATSGKIETILEAPRYIRPTSSGGGGTTALSVIIMARRGNR